MDLTILGARVIDPAQKKDETADIFVSEGKIKEIGPNLPKRGRAIEAAGLVACPGFIDAHTHMRDPGQTHKEDFASGSRAALAGGVTTLVAMPNTQPVVDNPGLWKEVQERAGLSAPVHIHQTAAMTKDQLGSELCDYAALKAAGCRFISSDGREIPDAGIMRDALREAAKYNLLPMCHCDDPAVIKDGVVNEGKTAGALGVAGHAPVAEEIAVIRNILLAESVNAPIHICHVSSAKSADLIRAAKKRGAKVTCETAPHYISLTDEAVAKTGPDAKMNPPLRTAEDVAGLIGAIVDGTVDCIATDHAPHTPAEKAVSLEKAPFGIVGLETMLGVCLKYLVAPGHITLSRLIELLSANPAKILGLPSGTLAPGAPADIVLFDPAAFWQVDKEELHSKGKNTPYQGESLPGVVHCTIVGGKIAFAYLRVSQ